MNLKQVIIVRADLKMGKGKIAAQVAHASVELMFKVEERTINDWRREGMKKVVLKVSSEKELLELFVTLKRKFPTVLIRDAGRTQIESGSPTCIGIGPVPEHEIDYYIGHLKLL
jgi:PTH2 family peptidyl-tRNA hydrolase